MFSFMVLKLCFLTFSDHIYCNCPYHHVFLFQQQAQQWNKSNALTCTFLYNYIQKWTFVNYISPNLLIKNMQFAGVSLLINKKTHEFCCLSLGDGFPFVLIDYFGVCLFYLYGLFSLIRISNCI